MLVRLQDVFRSVFRRPDLAISLQTTARDIRGWDSLTHLELIAATEAEFGVKFSFREVMALSTVGDLVDLIGQKKSAKDA